MTSVRTIIALATVAALAPAARAQDTTVAPWARELITSAKLKEQRTLLIATPDGYRGGDAQYPVLVLLDADDRAQFGLAVANVRFLASRQAVPPLIVVGVMNGKDRTRDMTPPATGTTSKSFPTAGGASGLADFIMDEALPLVRAKYRAAPATILAGHSFGGLFALHVASTRPGTFAGVIAISPSLWWNDSTAVASYGSAIGRAAIPLRLFVTSGGLEPQIDQTTQRFVARVDSIKAPHLAFAYRRYPDDTHGLTPAPSLVDGLRFVFEPVSLSKLPTARLGPSSDSTAIAKAVAETERAYAEGARSLGLPTLLPEDALNQLGYNVLLGLRKPDWAIPVFKRNVALHPESANVYDSLGDAYIAKGDTIAAKAELRRAVEIATRTNHPVLGESTRKLQQLEQATQAGSMKQN
jgi:predicted alpha/beta superfamily hydrolase